MMRIPLVHSLAPRVRRALSIAGLVAVGAPATGLVFGSGVRAAVTNPVAPPVAEIVNSPLRREAAGVVSLGARLAFDSLMGRSGRVYIRLIQQEAVDAYPILIDRWGERARTPGIRSIEGAPGGGSFAFITLKPWREKRGARVNQYTVGWWPGERRLVSEKYDNPAGFVEVTPENVDTWISAHFRLRDFLARDQQAIWPKYVVLREELLDKLELLLGTLEAQGIPTQRVVVLSGFRHPHYNQRGWGEGMAYASRHQYGDAADIIIDADGNGRMDDLNHDGTVDFNDTNVINRAVESVERRFPELVGGLGLYAAVGPSGPFAHIDVRGTKARWNNLQSARRRGTTRWEYATSTPARGQGTGKCAAEGAMAVLCSTIRE